MGLRYRYHGGILRSGRRAPHMLHLGARWGRVVNYTSQYIHPWESGPVSHWMEGCVGTTDGHVVDENSLFPLPEIERRSLNSPSFTRSISIIKGTFWYTSWKNCGILYPKKSVVLYVAYVCLKSDKLLRFILIKLGSSKPKMLFLSGVAGRRKRCMLGNNWSSTISTFHHLLS
jgi:hypothetical protein